MDKKSGQDSSLRKGTVATIRQKFGIELRSLLGRLRNEQVTQPAGPQGSIKTKSANPPLLSVIVPVYNVEKYLLDCLQSLTHQSYRQLEIIVVDDGSPDNSYAIARKVADRDSRVHIVRQENGGLGAARNTGIEYATGEYITFVDSDDSVPHDAYQQMMESAMVTGSEVVVGAMVRTRNGKLVEQEWVQRVHDRDRLGIKASEFPEILRDFYSWNKIYNRDFWQRQGLSFREGVLFEDQPVVTVALTAAKTIDVLTATTYRWLIREDGSSLSQNMYSADKVRARLEATLLTRDYLLTLSNPSILVAWKWTLLQYHFPVYLGQARSLSEEAYDEVIRMISSVVSQEDLRSVPKVSPQNRVLVYLALSEGREIVEEYLNRRGRDLRSHPVEHSGEHVYAVLPFSTDDAYAVPRELLRIPDEDLQIEAVLDSAHWIDSSTLRLSGWAYFTNTDPRQLQQSIWVIITDDESGASHRIPVTPHTSPEATVRARHRWINYDSSGFTAEIDFSLWLKGYPPLNGKLARYHVSVEVQIGQLIGSSKFTSRTVGGSAEALMMSHIDDRVILRPKWHIDNGLQVFADRRAAVARMVRVEGPLVTITLEQLAEDFLPVVAEVEGMSTGLTRTILVTTDRDGRCQVTLDLDEVGSLGLPLLVRAVDELGRRRKIHLGSQASIFNPEQRIDVARSITGVMRLNAGPERIQLTDFSVRDDGVLYACGQTNAGAESVIFLELVSAKQTTAPVRASFDSDRVSWTVPLTQTRPGSNIDTLLPQAWYRLVAYRLNSKGDRVTLPLLTSPDLTGTMPARFEAGYLYGHFRNRGGQPGIQVQAAVTHQDRSLFQRTKYHEAYKRMTPQLQNAFYFQSLMGDCATDNQLAIHNYLRKQHPDIATYWGVVDYSVPLPEGAIPVIIHTEAWYEAMAMCRYICVNHELPTVFDKKPGQIVIQTYHGHPFKTMGVPRWDTQGISKSQQARNLEDRDRWDYLLSQSPSATKMYEQAIPVSAKILQVGHPRNDDLLFADESRRNVVRRALGIRDDQIAILYAPTWRDYAASNPWVSKMVELLNPYELATSLGGKYVVLLRGHPAHQRHPGRPAQGTGVVVVTDYPEINDLIHASDVGVFDYSSIRFDYSVTRKPMLFFTPDKEVYFATVPPLIPFDETTPGPQTRNNDELARELLQMDRYSEEYGQAYEDFIARFNPLDDGHATERFVESILVSE